METTETRLATLLASMKEQDNHSSGGGNKPNPKEVREYAKSILAALLLEGGSSTGCYPDPTEGKPAIGGPANPQEPSPEGGTELPPASPLSTPSGSTGGSRREYCDALDQMEALRAEFRPEDIQIREERGTELLFLEWATVQNRLLDVLGAGGFDLDVGRVFQSNTRIDLECILTIRYIDGKSQRVMGFGSSDIRFLRKEEESPLEERRWITDSFKSAWSDGMKVAASKLGVGLYLYESAGRERLSHRVQATQKAQEMSAELEKQKQLQIALTTCRECGGQVASGSFHGKYYSDPIALGKATLAKYRKRICLSCVEKRSEN